MEEFSCPQSWRMIYFQCFQMPNVNNCFHVVNLWRSWSWLTMDSSAAETQTHAERREGSAPSTSTSGLIEDGSKSNKESLKRKASKPAKTKSKKQRKARVSRTTHLGYTVQQAEDMLLVISSSTSQYDGSVWTPPKRGNKKRNINKGKGKATRIKKKKEVCAKPKIQSHLTVSEDSITYTAQNSTDYRWGQNLPEELLVNIFQMVVIQDGPVPFLCR